MTILINNFEKRGIKLCEPKSRLISVDCQKHMSFCHYPIQSLEGTKMSLPPFLKLLDPETGKQVGPGCEGHFANTKVSLVPNILVEEKTIDLPNIGTKDWKQNRFLGIRMLPRLRLTRCSSIERTVAGCWMVNKVEKTCFSCFVAQRNPVT